MKLFRSKSKDLRLFLFVVFCSSCHPERIERTRQLVDRPTARLCRTSYVEFQPAFGNLKWSDKPDWRRESRTDE
jgi:hypothetical protein